MCKRKLKTSSKESGKIRCPTIPKVSLFQLKEPILPFVSQKVLGYWLEIALSRKDSTGMRV